MKSPTSIELIVYFITLSACVEKFHRVRGQFQRARHGNETIVASKDGYQGHNFYLDYRARTSTDLPVSFRAPDETSQNFWNYDPQRGYPGVLPDDLNYFYNYGSRSFSPNVNGHLDEMSQLYNEGSRSKIFRSTLPETHPKPYPYEIQSTAPRNFLSQPKPIGASIVKLEKATELHEVQLTFGSTVPSHLGNLSTDADRREMERPDTFHIDELGFHSEPLINFRGKPNWSYQEIIADIINRIASGTISEEINKNNWNDTLPEYNDLGTTEFHSLNEASKTVELEEGPRNEATFPVTPDESGSSITSSKRSNVTRKKGNLREAELHSLNGILTFGNRIVKSKAAKGKSQKFKYDQDNHPRSSSNNSASPYGNGNAIKIVTDLTLQGLSADINKTTGVPGPARSVNVSSFINSELNPFWRALGAKNGQNIPKSNEETNFPEASHAVSNKVSIDPNDELSLDLKILRDTNWDGFTTESDSSATAGALQSQSQGGEKYLPNGKAPVDNSNNSSGNITMPNNTTGIKSDKNVKSKKNKTLIVETRVTKTISRKIPQSHSSLKNLKNQDHMKNNAAPSRGLRERTAVDVLDGIESNTHKKNSSFCSDIICKPDNSTPYFSEEKLSTSNVTALNGTDAGEEKNSYRNLHASAGRKYRPLLNSSSRRKNIRRDNDISTGNHSATSEIVNESNSSSFQNSGTVNNFTEINSQHGEKENYVHDLINTTETINFTEGVQEKNIHYKRRRKSKRRRRGRRLKQGSSNATEIPA